MTDTQTMTGAQALIKALEMEHVEVMFGLPGGCILPAYDPLLESSIRHVLVRHEQGAGHMAEGYAHVTGRPGVAMVTSGPAATNMVTPLMDAYMDSIPMVVITGQVGTAAIGSDAFQECDTVGITRSCTKHNELVMTADDIPMAIRQAFHIATTGRPGPTLVDLPKDVLQNEMTWHWPTDDEVIASLPGYRPNTKGHPRMIKEAAKLIMSAERPVLYVGGGMLKARAAGALQELVDLTGIHVVTTLMARGVFPDSHPLNLGNAGDARQRGDHDRDAEERPVDRPRRPVRRPDHRQGRLVRPRRQGHPRRHRPGRAGQGAQARRSDRRRLPAGDRGDRPGDPGARRSAVSNSPTARRGRAGSPGWQETFPTVYEQSEPGAAAEAAVLPRATARRSARRNDTHRPVSASTRCGRRSTGGSRSRTPGSTPVVSARWASRSRRRSGPRSASPTAPCGRSTATAASR